MTNASMNQLGSNLVDCPHGCGQKVPYGVVCSCQKEKVNHPSHYGGDTTYEAVKVIEAWKLGFNLGNCIKYVCRAEHKGTPLDDLKKARWYLDREISNRENTK